MVLLSPFYHGQTSPVVLLPHNHHSKAKKMTVYVERLYDWVEMYFLSGDYEWVEKNLHQYAICSADSWYKKCTVDGHYQMF